VRRRDLKRFLVWCRDNGIAHIKLEEVECTFNLHAQTIKAAKDSEPPPEPAPTEEQIDKLAQLLQNPEAQPLLAATEEKTRKQLQAEIDKELFGAPLDP